jgi:hypothetical protein
VSVSVGVGVWCVGGWVWVWVWVWVCGCVGVWVCGCVGVCVCMCVCASERCGWSQAQWIFALQLVIKDALIAHEKYAELARRQQSRKNKHADTAAAALSGGAGAGVAGGLGGYANIVSGGSSMQMSSGSGSGRASADSSARGSAAYAQQAMGMFSATQLKRKLAEALPWDANRGPPTPALSLSNPASREGSLHGSSEFGDSRCRSLDVSQHTHGLEGGAHGGSASRRSRSRDGSAHSSSDYGNATADPDDSGKRVRKDGEALSKTLSVS